MISTLLGFAFGVMTGAIGTLAIVAWLEDQKVERDYDDGR